MLAASDAGFGGEIPPLHKRLPLAASEKSPNDHAEFYNMTWSCGVLGGMTNYTFIVPL